MVLLETEALGGEVEAHGDIVEIVSVDMENIKVELID